MWWVGIDVGGWCGRWRDEDGSMERRSRVGRSAWDGRDRLLKDRLKRALSTKGRMFRIGCAGRCDGLSNL